MNTFTLLKGLTQIAPSNDIRYYLNSVYITGDNAITTDGNRMVIVTHKIDNVNEPIILCKKDLVTKLKLFTKKSDVKLLVKDGKPYLNDYPLDVVDGKYPDIERVVNQYKDALINKGEPMGFDLKLMSTLCKALDVITDCKLSHGKFTFYDERTGVKIEKEKATAYLMPSRL